MVSSKGCVDSSNGCVSPLGLFVMVLGDLESSVGRGSRARNLRVTLESSSRASIIFLSASITFEGCSPGRGRSLFGPSGDEPRGSTDPRLDVDGDEGPGSGVLGRSSCSSSQSILSPVGRVSACPDAPAFRAARLSTRRSNSGDDSARVWDERTGLNCSFRPNALSTIFGMVRFRTRLGTTGRSESVSSRSIVEKTLEGGFLGL